MDEIVHILLAIYCMLHFVAWMFILFCIRWYRANYTMAENLEWGKGLGCDFVMKSCKFWIDQQRKL